MPFEIRSYKSNGGRWGRFSAEVTKYIENTEGYGSM